MAKSATIKRIDRLHSQNPTDAAWRARQAQIDADIEGLHRDPEIDKVLFDMRASELEPRERIERLKAYIRARHNPEFGAS